MADFFLTFREVADMSDAHSLSAQVLTIRYATDAVVIAAAKTSLTVKDQDD